MRNLLTLLCLLIPFNFATAQSLQSLSRDYFLGTDALLHQPAGAFPWAQTQRDSDTNPGGLVPTAWYPMTWNTENCVSSVAPNAQRKAYASGTAQVTQGSRVFVAGSLTGKSDLTGVTLGTTKKFQNRTEAVSWVRDQVKILDPDAPANTQYWVDMKFVVRGTKPTNPATQTGEIRLYSCDYNEILAHWIPLLGKWKVTGKLTQREPDGTTRTDDVDTYLPENGTAVFTSSAIVSPHRVWHNTAQLKITQEILTGSGQNHTSATLPIGSVEITGVTRK